MRDLKKYWEEVRAVERSLPDFVWLAAASDDDGLRLVETPKSAAARFIQSGSHRSATENEIAAHQAQQEVQRRQAFLDDLQRKGISVVPVSKREFPPARTSSRKPTAG